MALAPNALTTVEAIRLESERACDAKLTPFVERTINAVSDRVESFLGRPLAFQANTIEKLPGLGGIYLFVKRTPVLVVNSIKFDAETVDLTGIKIQSEEGLIFRSSGWNWTAQQIAGAEYDTLPDTEDRRYEIDYDGGYVTPQQEKDGMGVRTLPYDIEEAVILLVLARINRKGDGQDAAAEQFAGYSVTYRGAVQGGDMTPVVKDMLLRHQRLAQA